MECAFVIVADRLQRPGALGVVNAQAERILMQLERVRHGKPLAGDHPCSDHRGEGPASQLGTRRRIVRPGQIGILAEDRLPVVVGDQLGELLGAMSGDFLQPASRLGVCACPPDSRQTGIGHIAHEGMLEDELELPCDGRCRSNRYQPLGFEREQARSHLGVVARSPHRLFPERASDHGGLLKSALLR